MLKKLGYKWHLLVKNPKLWIYKCKINFYKCKFNSYKCKLTCDKKLCQVIRSCSEICWKKLKFLRIFFYKFALPSPCPGRSKSWVPANFIFPNTFPIFFWVGDKRWQIWINGNLGFLGPESDHFGQKSHFWSENSAEWGPAARPYPASTSWLVKYLKWPWPWPWPWDLHRT